jgi:hypothetical protein
LSRAFELDLGNGDGTLTVIKGRVRFHLARALWSRPAEREWAKALAREALAFLEAVDPAPAELAQLQQWLAKHDR